MKGKKLALALGMLTLTTSCAAVSNSSAKQSQKVTQVRDSSKLATAIKVDGSSTVYPITQAMPAAGYAYAKDYQADSKNQVQVAVNISGTTGGFEKFCAGETDKLLRFPTDFDSRNGNLQEKWCRVYGVSHWG